MTELALRFHERSRLFLSALCLALLMTSGAGLAQESGTQIASDPNAEFDILIVDLQFVRSQAIAYQTVQRSAEVLSDEINGRYQEGLRALEAERERLIDAQFDMEADAFRQASAALEQRAVRLEQQRLSNLSQLETNRREVIAEIDEQLNLILVEIRNTTGARYILNQQVVILWPSASNISDQVLNLLNERAAPTNLDLPALRVAVPVPASER